MMSNNKILTVSYGTFSCTLEGFDDSFDTMKAIAEYFRDLAADDRYFGAEPPQPDAELLARIAEREVSRRVEAQEHEGRILLKAHDEAVDDTAETDVMPLAKSAAPVSPAVQTETTPATQDISPRTEAPVEAAAPTHTDDASDGRVDNAPEPDVEAHEEDTADTTTDDQMDAQIAATVAEAVVDDPSLEEAMFDEPEMEEAEPASAEDVVETSAFAQESEEEPFEEPSVAVHHVEFESSEETVAEHEEGSIEAFFAQSTAPADDGYEDEEVAASGADDEPFSLDVEIEAEEIEISTDESAGETFAHKLERIRAVVSKQDSDEEEYTNGYQEDLEAAPSVGSLSEFDSTFAMDEQDDADQAEPMFEMDVITQAAQDIAEAFEQDEEAFEPVEVAENKREEQATDDLDLILQKIESEAEDEGFDGNLFEDSAEAEDEVKGRLLKVDRTDLEAALASGDLEDLDDEDTPSDDLMAEEDEDDPVAEEVAPRQSLPEIDEDASEDVSRLMAEADHQMQEPEGKTRRSAFAHLRAAVAARFADRSMDAEDQLDEAEAEAYRNDLAEVVRPRRPEAGDNRTERPADDIAAPLKLVAEQRIDHDDESDSRGPIAPRRVAASAEDDDGAIVESDFAAYAAERGAQSLPELLEAAAAYLSYVEGHEQFSRPELMSRVRQADCGDFSREDGLRSFGQLLRTGKIEKIKGGRFAATEGIGYKPGHRAVG